MLLSSLFEQSLARNYNQIHDAKNEQAKKSLTGLSVCGIVLLKWSLCI